MLKPTLKKEVNQRNNYNDNAHCTVNRLVVERGECVGGEA